MAPLLLCAFGIVFVLLRIHSNEVDVVPDSIGLALYAAGLWRLHSSSRLLSTAAVIGGAAAVLALADFAPGLLSGDTEEALAFLRGVVVALAAVFGAAGLRGLAQISDRPVARAYAAAALGLAAGLCLFVGGWAVNPNDHALAVALVGWSQVLTAVALAAYAVVLLMSANHVWAQPPSRKDSPP